MNHWHIFLSREIKSRIGKKEEKKKKLGTGRVAPSTL
jgi:hypothetical protein